MGGFSWDFVNFTPRLCATAEAVTEGCCALIGSQLLQVDSMESCWDGVVVAPASCFKVRNKYGYIEYIGNMMEYVYIHIIGCIGSIDSQI